MSGARGFALLAVLWVVVALGALTAGALAHARSGAALGGERIGRMRARWAAEGCAAVAVAQIARRLRAGSPLASPPADTLHYANGATCSVAAHDPGGRANRDSAPGLAARLDSSLGALGARAAIARDTLFTTYGDGRINVNVAAEAVLAALPGFTPEAMRIVLEARAWDRPLRDPDDLLARVSPRARQEIVSHLPELLQVIAFRPAGLVVAAAGWSGEPGRGATVELFVVPSDGGAVVVRRRLW